MWVAERLAMHLTIQRKRHAGQSLLFTLCAIRTGREVFATPGVWLACAVMLAVTLCAGSLEAAQPPKTDIHLAFGGGLGPDSKNALDLNLQVNRRIAGFAIRTGVVVNWDSGLAYVGGGPLWSDEIFGKWVSYTLYAGLDVGKVSRTERIACYGDGESSPFEISLFETGYCDYRHLSAYGAGPGVGASVNANFWGFMLGVQGTGQVLLSSVPGAAATLNLQVGAAFW